MYEKKQKKIVTSARLARLMAHHNKAYYDTIHTVWKKKPYRKTKKIVWIQFDSRGSWRIMTKSWTIMILYVCGKKRFVMTRHESRESSWMLVFPPRMYSVMRFFFNIHIVSWCIIIVYRFGKNILRQISCPSGSPSESMSASYLPQHQGNTRQTPISKSTLDTTYMWQKMEKVLSGICSVSVSYFPPGQIRGRHQGNTKANSY